MVGKPGLYRLILYDILNMYRPTGRPNLQFTKLYCTVCWRARESYSTTWLPWRILTVHFPHLWNQTEVDHISDGHHDDGCQSRVWYVVKQRSQEPKSQ